MFFFACTKRSAKNRLKLNDVAIGISAVAMADANPAPNSTKRAPKRVYSQEKGKVPSIEPTATAHLKSAKACS